MDKIAGDANTFMKHAPMTAQTYMIDAIKIIDETFGKGYAKDHPQLLGAFLQTCAVDFATAAITSALQDMSDAIRTDS